PHRALGNAAARARGSESHDAALHGTLRTEATGAALVRGPDLSLHQQEERGIDARRRELARPPPGVPPRPDRARVSLHRPASGGTGARMADEVVSYRREDRVGIVTLDDGKANAMSLPWFAALNAVLDRVEADAPGALVLGGRAGMFSAGLNLKVLPTLPEAELQRTLVAFGQTLLRLRLPDPDGGRADRARDRRRRDARARLRPAGHGRGRLPPAPERAHDRPS